MHSHRKNIMLGTAGHVDHGKTALVKVLTGCDTDTLAEEKQRGLTIDLGFAPCRLAGNRVVGIVDVPGHVDFIRNMVAGAHGIDVVMFVVAADDGIMPQTHEHLHILTLMGLRHGLVALTKIDLVESGRRQDVVDHLRGLLAGTFLEAAPVCPLSNVTSEGFEQFFEELNRVVDACEDRPSSGLFRVWVEDVFTIRGSGTVITGIPSSGTVRVGDKLHLAPGGLSGHVRRMQVYGEESPEARAGECVALNLPEIDHQAVHRGQVLCEADALASVTMAEAELRILPSIKGRIEDYMEVHLHLGTASSLARLAMLENSEMTAGQRQMVQLRLTEPVALAPGHRFVVRASVADGSGGGLTTIGGGTILGAGNVRLRRKKPWTLEALSARREALGHTERWCDLMAREQATPLAADEFRRKCLMKLEEFAAITGALRAAGTLVQTSTGTWVHRDVIEQAASKLCLALQAFHAANPQRAGLGREELFSTVGGDVALLELAAAVLLQTKRVVSNGTVYAQTGWSPKVADRDQQLCERITDTLRKSGWSPPGSAEIAAALGELPPKIERFSRLLVERGVVVRLDERILMHR
ncbi:MAG: selenocysteine-specific translation elongation factor [Verrucomicrobia bacterium]|nr:selenocysteine-specific translation elongation factor [Verrucomicrobiota bacterium]